MASEADFIFLMLQTLFTPGGFIVLLIMGIIILSYLAYSKYGHFQNYNVSSNDGFEQYGKPDYGLAIGLPVAIVAVIVIFLFIAKRGKK